MPRHVTYFLLMISDEDFYGGRTGPLEKFYLFIYFNFFYLIFFFLIFFFFKFFFQFFFFKFKKKIFFFNYFFDKKN